MAGMSERPEAGGVGGGTQSTAAADAAVGAPAVGARDHVPVLQPDLFPPVVQRDAGHSWVRRSERDRRAAVRLELLAGTGSVVLRDRRLPGGRARGTLIAVSPAGVFVIDARHRRGLVHTKRPGPMSDLGRLQLHVGRRDCTPLLDAVSRKVEAVRTALAAIPWASEVPVQAVLCLTRADWGFASPIEVDGVWVAWPKLLPGRLRHPVVMDSPTVKEVSSMIGERLPGYAVGAPVG